MVRLMLASRVGVCGWPRSHLGEAMRAKIIWVNGGIMATVTLLTFFLVRSSLAPLLNDSAEIAKAASRAAQAAQVSLSLDASRAERWVAEQAASEEVSLIYSAGLETARQERAMTTANRLKDAAQQDPAFSGAPASLVLFVNAEGVGLGRNGSTLMRGENMGAAYPGLLRAISHGRAASDLWISQTRQEQFAVSYGPVRAQDGQVVGALVVGTPLNDERLRAMSDVTSGAILGIALADAAAPGAIAVSTPGVLGPTALEPVVSAVRGGGAGISQGADGRVYVGRPLLGYGDQKALVVASVAPRSADVADEVLGPVLLSGALGLVLVVIGGILLGNYISRPVAEIEEGLLLLINGHRDLRFDLEHDELGGLTSRINALLNALLEVDEGSEDDAPRP